MDPTESGILFAVGLFIGIPLSVEVGRRLSIRRSTEDPEGVRQGLGVVEGAVFSLLGLLIAFSFSGAAARFDGRRHLIIEEANYIGTAYLRLDVLPPASQPALRELFRQYLDSRIETYRKPSDHAATQAARARSLKLQREIWSAAVSASQGTSPATMLLLPALNQMIDIVATRAEVTKIHPPVIVYVMLGFLTLTASLLAGYGMGSHRSRSWIHILVFSAVLSLTVYVITDLEYPRFGFIRIEDSDSVMVELRESMK